MKPDVEHSSFWQQSKSTLAVIDHFTSTCSNVKRARLFIGYIFLIKLIARKYQSNSLNVSNKCVKHKLSVKCPHEVVTGSQQIRIHWEAYEANGAVLHLVSITTLTAVGRSLAAKISQSLLHCFRSISPALRWLSACPDDGGNVARQTPKGSTTTTHTSTEPNSHTHWMDPINQIAALSARLYRLSYCACSYGRMSINPEDERGRIVFRCWLIRHKHIHYIACTEIFTKMLICMQCTRYGEYI